MFLFGKRRKGAERPPFRVRDSFLSAAEFSFYKVLEVAVGDVFAICPRVNLKYIFYVPQSSESRGHESKLDQKPVDFLLCEKSTMKPLVGVVLDDSSHQLDKRQDQDLVFDDIFVAAKLPLARVFTAKSYNPVDLRNFLCEAAKVGKRDAKAPGQDEELRKESPPAGRQEAIQTAAGDPAEQAVETAPPFESGAFVRQEHSPPVQQEQDEPHQEAESPVRYRIKQPAAPPGEEHPAAAAPPGEEHPAAAGPDPDMVIQEVSPGAVSPNTGPPSAPREGAAKEGPESPGSGDRVEPAAGSSGGAGEDAEKQTFSRKLNLDQIRERVSREVAAHATSGPVPDCPRCAVPMVLRTSRRGVEFYSCANAPRCREVRGLYE